MPPTLRKVLLIGAIAAAFTAFFALDLHQQLTFENLEVQQERFQSLYAEHRVATLAGFFVAYVAIVALSLPGASVMTIAAGALFGVVTGVVLVSFASTLGASLAFLSARYLLRDTLESRFGDRLAVIHRGVERDGAWYLFTMRLVPLFPFFVVNLVMGLTRMRLLTFALVSQVGALAATIIYVNAGTQLALLQSPADIVSPALLASLVALGFFPLAARKLMGWLRPAVDPAVDDLAPEVA